MPSHTQHDPYRAIESEPGEPRSSSAPPSPRVTQRPQEGRSAAQGSARTPARNGSRLAQSSSNVERSPTSSPHSSAREIAAQDLPRAGLGELVGELDLLGHGERREPLSDEVHDVELQLFGGREAGVQGDHRLHDLHVDLVRLAERRGLGHRLVLDECGLDLERPHEVPTGVDHVVVAPHEPVVPVGVHARAIAGYVPETGIVAESVRAVAGLGPDEFRAGRRRGCSSRRGTSTASPAETRAAPPFPVRRSVRGSRGRARRPRCRETASPSSPASPARPGSWPP